MDAVMLLGGLVVTAIVEFAKRRFGLTTTGVLLLVLVLSFFGAGIYGALSRYGLWDAFLGVLVSAGAIYTFILKNVLPAPDNRTA